MNTTFNFQRFIKLFCNEWQINLKKFLLLWAGLFGIVVIYFSFSASVSDRAELFGTFLLFFLVILAFQGILTSIYWGDFTTKTRTQALFVLPASKTEKFLSKNIFLLVIFPVLAYLFFVLLFQINIAYNVWAEKTFSLAPRQDTDQDVLLYIIHNRTYMFLSIWFFAACSYLCGAMTFRKLAPVKTFLSLLVFYFAMIPVTALFYTLITGHYPSVYIPFLYLSENGVRGFSFTQNHAHYYYLASLVIGIYLIIVARVKFNEKTI